MVRSICLVLGFLVCIVGCKKPEESQPEPAVAVTGDFQLTKTTPSWGNTIIVAYALFFHDSVIHVDSVLINNSLVPDYPAVRGYYMESSDTALIQQPSTWHIIGKNGVPSFTHTLGGGFPDFNLPRFSSIGKDTALNITLPANAFANADSAWVVLTKDSISLRHGIDAITGRAVFSPAELNLFQPMGIAKMTIIAAKFDTVKIQGATFRFSRTRDWNENIRIE